MDSTGCAASQLDADLDGIDDATDACPDTPAGEQVDDVGCSSSMQAVAERVPRYSGRALGF